MCCSQFSTMQNVEMVWNFGDFGCWKISNVDKEKQLRSSVAMALAARARGAVLGSLVADAAAVPVHWCYDPEKLAEHLKQACQAD